MLGCAATLMQCYWGVQNRVQPIHVVFNVAGMMAPAIGATMRPGKTLTNVTRPVSAGE